MGAIVDDAIHVKVKAIEFWDPVFRYQLRDRRVSLTHPSKEFRDTHDCYWVMLLERLL